MITLAPGVTFWDAGEFIAAAWVLGIPHPPGTPLYVALAHTWAHALAPVIGVARAMNLLSAMATATAGGITAWLFAREPVAADAGQAGDESLSRRDGAWCGVTAALCAGLMASVWANATETEVYAIALLHAALMLACAARAGEARGDRSVRWTLATAYAMLLAPAVHLSVLVAAPAAIALAARESNGAWRVRRAVALLGVLVIAAGLGRVSPWLAGVGVVMVLAAQLRRNANEWRRAAGLLALGIVAASALLVMLVRARHDPALNQGHPSTFGALADVVARRQYDVAGLWPRRAPVWLQLANLFEYVDWQAALGWGRGVFTSPARVAATVMFALLAVVGARSLRRESPRLADAMLVLLVSGTLGVMVYLNMRAGASLGWGILPDSAPHEARERDYFFVYGFWAWGCLAGCGAVALVRRRHWPVPAALVVALLPLVGNWRVSDRARAPEAGAAGRVATALLASAPRDAVLFVAGDNDSYPLWYAQQVEGERRDVTLVTLPLLSADWYTDEIARRSGLRWRTDEPVAGTEWRHEQQAALIARAARNAGRPVAASPRLTVQERSLLGSGWVLHRVDYVSRAAPGEGPPDAVADPAFAPLGLARQSVPLPDIDAVDGAPRTMLSALECARLARPQGLAPGMRDSLEVSCNFR